MTIDTIEQKIIFATIECIEKYGLMGVTNRRIGEIANVSHAAINYYFRSKENLIAKVMEMTINVAFDWEKLELLPGATARERCIAIFENMIIGGCNYPEIMRAHFYGSMTGMDEETLVMNPYKHFMVKLCEDLSARGTDLSGSELQLACTQIASACFMVILVPKLNLPDFGIDLRDEKKRHQFVSRLVDKLL